jgi:hypothetical protein
MNKLDALKTLSHAYYYLINQGTDDVNSQATLSIAFGYVRRSLSLADLAPTTRDTEGFNGRGPLYL